MWRRTAVLVAIALAAGGVTAGASTAGGLRWGECADESLRAAGADCTTVVVPLDHLQPDGRVVRLAVSRLKADPAKRRGVLLTNPGGPGGPGTTYPLELKPLLGEVAQQYDVIGIDPRFMGASDPVACGPLRLPDVFRSSLTRADFEKSRKLAEKTAAGCRDDRLPYASIRNVARDMDTIRAALGEQKISYYGVSWGADLGVVYSQLFPGRVDRMVVDSVTDVEGSEYHHLATGERAEAAFDEWAAWVAWRDDQYHLGRTGMEVRATVSRLARRPVTIDGRRLDSASLPWAIQSALGDEKDREVMARNIRALIDGKSTEELSGWLQQYFTTEPIYSRFAAASIAFTCNDNGWPKGPAPYWRDVQRTRQTEPLFHATFLACAFWKYHTSEPELVIGNDVPMLIVQAERDNIPLGWAQALQAKLPNSTLKTVDRRAHGVYEFMSTTVNDYLAR
ncbi:alpha/beta fold hydrolase [Kribbella sp. NPDC056951]|uniref:alpha/beta fold hydrolase n=1 Tax=Kribbella sp. NPDC056951 TaxID=3345978 RepID=UPI00363ACA09